MSSVKWRPFFLVLMCLQISPWCHHMASKNSVDTDPDKGTKPLPETTVTYPQWGVVAFTYKQI